MNPLDSFTVERLEELALAKGFPSLNVVRDLAKIALAAKQAKPNYYIVRIDVNDAWGPETTLRAQETQLDAFKCKDDHGGIIIPVYTMPTTPQLPDGWVLVPKEPTEDMVIQGFESSPEDDDEDFEAMSGCQQAAYCAELCWAAMLAAAPKP